METLITLVYLAGFIPIILIIGSLLPELKSHADIVDMFLKILVFGGIMVAVPWLWFSFGDSVVRFVFEFLFGTPSAPSATTALPEKVDSLTIFDHPVIWFVHLFAYVPILVAIPAVIVSSFALSESNIPFRRKVARPLKYSSLGFVALIFYWHLSGMKILVSWFA